MSDNHQTNYIYLLQEREFIKTHESIYKVGMTTKENHTRFNQYPKGSILLLQIICDNCKKCEKNIIKLFKETFTHRKEIGNEYFDGDYKKMIEIIYNIIKNENNENIDYEIDKCSDIICENNQTEENANIYKIDTYGECKMSESEKSMKFYQKHLDRLRKYNQEHKDQIKIASRNNFQKIKADTEKYELYKQKKREYYYKRKQIKKQNQEQNQQNENQST